MSEPEQTKCANCAEMMRPLVEEKSKSGTAIKCPLCGHLDWVPNP